jgi:EAL domain-containing protein (putative c-di-GMP-specific phosphodiesterase class I)/ActR/RegA family two-component response regulator
VHGENEREALLVSFSMASSHTRSGTVTAAGHRLPDAADGSGARASSARPNAFVIDDEAGICKFISFTLAGLGLSAESFQTAQDAVAAIEHNQPAIVFLDVALGQADAIDVIRSLSAKGYGGVVQLMSGHKSALLDDVHRVGVSHGLNMCPPLEKPFRRDAVELAVSQLSLYERPSIAVSVAPQLSPGLDAALASGWLELWYQPKVDIRTGALGGIEGVVRYRHPDRGVHAIDGLLAAADTATRTALTEHFVVAALRDWSDLDQAGLPLPISLNAGFDALANVDLTDLIRRNWPRSGSRPRLVLEVGEREVINDLNLAHEIATQLRIYDITLAIGNFGAGFSSLERLSELSFSELKLHPSFVAGCTVDTRNAGICRTAIELAHRLGLVAVADGVSDSTDLRALAGMGCDLGQGSLLGQAMPRVQLEALVRERTERGEGWLPVQDGLTHVEAH